jgi:LacI family transcriptional regulator
MSFFCLCACLTKPRFNVAQRFHRTKTFSACQGKLCGELTFLIYTCFKRLIPNLKKRTTIVDIASKIGITASTVSKVFSNHPRISAETREKVFKTAKELGYQPNILATGLRKGHSGLIGVVVPAVNYSFFSSAIKGIEEQITAAGYNVIIAQTRDQFDLEKKQLEGLLRAQVEGLIGSIAAGTTDHSVYRNIAFQIPLVLFDRTFSAFNISEVTIDDFEGAVKAVEHLISKGYQRIAHLAGYEHVQPFRKRIEGYKAALIRHGLKVDEGLILQCAPNKDEGEEAMKKLLNLERPPDAIFATSDYLAYGAMKAIKKRGLSIPSDIGVVGFSNEEFSSQVTPSITTVNQQSETMGSIAAKLLIEQLAASKEGGTYVVQREILEPQLIIRESSMRA